MVDLLMQEGLTQCTFFPSFLENFRAIVGFLRDRSMFEVFCRNLVRTGKTGLKVVLETLVLPNVAEWRWHTLPECMEVLERCIRSIKDSFVYDWFASSDERDRTRLDRIRRAFGSEDFMWQWSFVYWFSNQWLGKLMHWIGTCKHGCAEGVECFFRGRLLPWAYDTAKRFFEEGLETCNSWGISEFHFVYIWQQGQAAVRAVFVSGMDAIEYLNDLPWLLARLRQPGIVTRVLDRWHETPREDHHPTSNKFCDPEDIEGLAADLHDMADDGTGITPALDKELSKIENIPCDDIAGEGPHAKASRVIHHSVAGGFEWCASTCRLNANLENGPKWCTACNRDMQTEWDRWSSVIKTTHTERPSRLPRREVCVGTKEKVLIMILEYIVQHLYVKCANCLVKFLIMPFNTLFWCRSLCYSILCEQMYK